MKPGIFSSVRVPSIPRIEQRHRQFFVIHANGQEVKCHNVATARLILARSSTEVK